MLILLIAIIVIIVIIIIMCFECLNPLSSVFRSIFGIGSTTKKYADEASDALLNTAGDIKNKCGDAQCKITNEVSKGGDMMLGVGNAGNNLKVNALELTEKVKEDFKSKLEATPALSQPIVENFSAVTNQVTDVSGKAAEDMSNKFRSGVEEAEVVEKAKQDLESKLHGTKELAQPILENSSAVTNEVADVSKKAVEDMSNKFLSTGTGQISSFLG